MYLDPLIEEWGLEQASRKVQVSMDKVLSELSASAQLLLRKEPRLQVLVLPEADYSVWAYFPVHRRRWIAQKLGDRVKPRTRALLVISEKHFEEQRLRQSENDLRDHLGHALLYLRRPKARNECVDAEREWKHNCATAPAQAASSQTGLNPT